MGAVAAVDVSVYGAIGTMVVGIVAAIVAPFLSRRKTSAETESIATRTMLEVNEGLRDELRDLREVNEGLRAQLRKRDERIEALEGRVAQLRRDVDVLEAEITGLRGSPA